jgi:hypothetical protein
MRKTSTIIGLTIATILTAYLSALTLSNQVFARGGTCRTFWSIRNQPYKAIWDYKATKDYLKARTGFRTFS